MSKNHKRVKHSGIVSKIDNNQITVNITNASACSSCHSKTYCSLSDKKEKSIVVNNIMNPKQYTVGDHVNVIMNLSAGFKAIILGYLIPFLLLSTSLITIYLFTNNEVISGIISLAILFPYYYGMFLLRRHVSQNFEFTIES